MPTPQLIDVSGDRLDLCVSIAQRWQIEPQLSARIIAMAALLPFTVRIFSGHRNAQQQADAGPTAARFDLSTHTTCPATGADVEPTMDDWDQTEEVKLMFGRAAETVGLRWGGGARRENGIPVGVEWHHVDLGPRQR